MQTLRPEYFFDLSQFPHRELFRSCTFVWQALDKLVEYLKKTPLGTISSAEQQLAYLVNPELISVGEGTVIEPGAYIKGPCIIGKNCIIRHGAYIRGDVIIGDNTVVGHTTEIKHSVLLNGAHAAHFDYIGDSIIGNKVNLGAGVKCANLRFNNEPIVIKYKQEVISTGMRKLGAIIGDNTQIGCNAVLNPGTLLGQDVHCFPLINFGGFAPSKSILKSRSY